MTTALFSMPFDSVVVTRRVKPDDCENDSSAFSAPSVVVVVVLVLVLVLVLVPALVLVLVLAVAVVPCVRNICPRFGDVLLSAPVSVSAPLPPSLLAVLDVSGGGGGGGGGEGVSCIIHSSTAPSTPTTRC